MPQKHPTDTIERIDVSESASGDPSRLAELARQAYQQRRTKDCLDLTRALLLIDPENVEAQQMRTAIRAEIQQDLDNARNFLRQAQARQISQESSPPETAVEADSTSDSESVSPTASPTSGPWSRSARKIAWMALAGVAAVIVVSVVKVRSPAKIPEASPSVPIASDQPKSVVSESASPTSLPAPNSSKLVIPIPISTTAVPSRPLPSPPVPVARASSPETQPDSTPPQPAAAASGFLAVSSQTSVDIYENGMYLGSSPVSLELPAGQHSLEYRHANLRRTITHSIIGNETLKISVAFEVNVPINSKPWSRVFLEGAERRELGQTPMSSISVPIGAILTFENPQFQSKKYRVTGNENGIQIVFP